MFEISEATLPATVEAPDASDFIESIRVGNEVDAVSYGTTELAYEPAEELPHYNDRFNPHRLFVARVDGAIVGRAVYETTTSDDMDSAWLAVGVLPEFRGRGIGTALAAAVEEVAVADGKAKVLAYAGIQDVPGPRIDSPTGFGSIPAASRDVRFLESRGFSFEQVERISRLPLPIALEDRLAAAIAASGPEYRLHRWMGSAPERWYEDIAILATRMSTDAPSAGLEEPEDVWTVERVAAAAERDRLSPRTRLETVVEHVPTGTLVGFTVLSVPAQLGRSVDQYATLVLREHRGHRLGMLLKVANLAYLHEVLPGHPSVITFNAEENRHMLSVNEALGFVPIGYESAWRKNLA